MRASWLAGWLAGPALAQPTTRRGGTKQRVGRTGGKEAKETSGNSPSPHNLAQPFVIEGGLTVTQSLPQRPNEVSDPIPRAHSTTLCVCVCVCARCGRETCRRAKTRTRANTRKATTGEEKKKSIDSSRGGRAEESL
ncbi:hypothetical protein B0T20DRAFT_426916, partial [Sordaria brevicollis]